MKNTIALSLSLFILAHANPATAQSSFLEPRVHKWYNATFLAAFTGISGLLALQCAKLIQFDGESKSLIPNFASVIAAAIFTKLAYDSGCECKETLDQLL